MCGIAGILSSKKRMSSSHVAIVRSMVRTLSHRGPDDEGAWADEQAGVALGFRRLAILDTSGLGHQPMLSREGRYSLVFNGEIYNFRELRHSLELLGHTFHTGTDTEVILAAASQWGPGDLPKRLEGMFAYALWDRDHECLQLARDRIGIKPLYYGETDGTLLFASELPAICAFPGFSRQLEPGAVGSFLEYGYVPTPLSIYKGIRKLPPGTTLRIKAAHSLSLGEPESYWTLRDPTLQSARSRQEVPWHAESVAETTAAVLLRAVERQMVADVPLGAFLSGGIDSSLVVALMSVVSPKPVKTYTIGFSNSAHDESRHARRIASHLGTDHHELIVSPEHALAVIPRLPEIYSEPFADSSQIPTYLVSRLARASVTVTLSGDGGDELFAGYNRYLYAEAVWRKSRKLGPLGPALAAPIQIAARLSRSTGHWARMAELGPKLANILRAESLDSVYESLCRIGTARDLTTTRTGSAAIARGSWAAGIPFASDATSRMQQMDMVSYLPDDILTKVDRASMAASLEVRVPLLDEGVVNFALSLPLEWRIRNGESKWPLRQVLGKYLPKSYLDQPKHGFSIPLSDWLRGPLRDWAESLLSRSALLSSGVLDEARVRKLWDGFLRGGRASHPQCWAVLMFQAWCSHHQTGIPTLKAASASE